MTEQRIERIFDTGDQAELIISNIEGTIEVHGWDRPQVQIVAVKHGDDNDTFVDIGGEGTRVWAKTHAAQGLRGLFRWVGRGGPAARVDYAARVPRCSHVAVSGVSGPVLVADVEGEVNVHTVNGQVRLERLDGRAKARAVHSTIDAHGLRGELQAETVSGQVRVADSQLTRLETKSVNGTMRAEGGIAGLRAESVNGAIHLRSALSPEGEYAVRTVNGRFRMKLPADTAGQVSASGTNLHVDCQLRHQVEGASLGHWRAQLNDGDGARITFQTVSGTLRIEPLQDPEGKTEDVREAGLASADEAQAVEPEYTSKMEILHAVERGELDVEEALERLRGLN